MKKWIIWVLAVLPMVSFSQHVSNSPVQSEGTWMIIGSPGFSPGTVYFSDIAVSPEGEPYVAFMDMTLNQKISVMKFNGTVWQHVGPAGFSDGPTDYINIAFSPAGVPYVAYKDESDSSKAIVRRFDGNNWVNVGVPGFSLPYAFFISLAFTPSGEPSIAFGDYGSTVYGMAVVMKFNGTQWEYVGPKHFSAGAVLFICHAYSPAGEPYVIYEDNSGFMDKATVMKFNGTSWVYVGAPGFSADVANYTTIAFNPSGVPYVAYMDGGYNTKAVVKKFSNDNWENVGTPGFSPIPANNLNLAFGPTGDPYVSFGGSSFSPNKASVMKFNGIEWDFIGIPEFTAGNTEYTSMAISPDGKIYIGYKDLSLQGKETVMYYDNPTGSTELTNPKFVLYPNPASDKLIVESMNKGINMKLIAIENAAGRELLTVQTNGTREVLNVVNYPSGVYFVTIKTNNGIKVEKFCKK